MSNPANSIVQNLLPVQAYFSVDGTFQTFIGQGKPFYANINPIQSGLTITNSTIDSSPIGATTPSTGAFTSIATGSGTITSPPVGATDIVNYLALQSYAVGISWKAPVTAATTTNITLSGTQTIDTKAVNVGDTVLVKNQTNAAQNGIYTVNAGAWTYATGCTTWAQYVSALVFVEFGGQAGSAWYCTAQPGGTLGVTNMVWSNFSVSSTYTAGTGLTLTGYQFSITNTAVTAGSYGSASSVGTFAVNAQGQLTAAGSTSIAIAASQITSGTIASSLISGSYTGITGVGTLTAGAWNASTIGVAYGGTGATTLTGYVKGSGTSAFTASATVPTTDLSGTISNAQLANSTISGVSLGGNLFSLTAGTNISFSSGTTYNGSAAITINASSTPQVYPGAGIANSTGSAWGTSYSTTGSGTVVALATSPSFTTPSLGVATGTSLQVTGGLYSTSSSSFTYTDGIVVDYITGNGRFSVGSADGFTWYNGGVATTSLMALSSAGVLSGATWQGSTVAVGYGGTGVATLSGLAYGNGTSAFTAATAAQVVSVIGTTAVTNATNATNTAITDDTTTNASVYPTWVTTTTGNLPQKTSSTKLSFNPSTGALSSTSFSGSGSSLTGIPTSIAAGTGISVNASTGAVTVTNSGVTSVTAGTGISVSGSTGSVTISSTGAYVGFRGQAFTSNGTFTIPSGITQLKITVVGGGGGGGGGGGSGPGAGGGGGGTAISYLTGLTSGGTLAVTIGGAGSAGGSAGNGGNAGNSTVASGTQSITTITGSGGQGGAGQNPQQGGLGGIGSSGTINIRGQGGSYGSGGSSTLGGGGPANNNGGAYGGGGGGGQAGGCGSTGFNGSAGIVVFEW